MVVCMDDKIYEVLERKALEIYQLAAQEWLADDPAYQRLLRLSENPELKLCLALEEEPQFAEWQDADIVPEDIAEQNLVELTLFYAAAADDDNQAQETVLKLLLSADPDNGFCALVWFPD